MSEKDRGQSHAINKGFERASSDILGYLNSDDTYQPGALAAVLEAFQKNSEVDFVYGDFNYIDAAGNRPGKAPDNQLLLRYPPFRS